MGQIPRQHRDEILLHQIFPDNDNGQSWEDDGLVFTNANEAKGESIGDLFLLDDKNAWLLTYNAATRTQSLSRTTTGLKGFAKLPNPMPAAFSTIHFFTASVGVAVVREPWAIYRTTDGGSTWGLVDTPGFTNPVTAYNVGTHSQSSSLWLTIWEGTIVRTADAGLTWTATSNMEKYVAFENQLQGLAYKPLAGTSNGTQQL